MIRVGLVGGTGYTGVELMRLLSQHPNVALAVITSREQAGKPVTEIFPSLRGQIDHRFSLPDINQLTACDLVFFAAPHGVAMAQAPDLLAAGVKVIDLSADFRIKNAALWEHWYGMPHTAQDALAEAVYGLPELNREAIRHARLIANPGCYPTAIQLGFAPLLAAGLIETDTLIANATSGVSGAGRTAALAQLSCEVSENIKAYAVNGHRHLPEITQGLTLLTPGENLQLTFVPHLAPMMRGIHATLYARLRPEHLLDPSALQTCFEAYYRQEAFVDVLPQDSHPNTSSVKGSNLCRMAVHRPQQGDQVVVLSVIDNLVKGAAGQAVQNMNILYDFDEGLGLTQGVVFP